MGKGGVTLDVSRWLKLNPYLRRVRAIMQASGAWRSVLWTDGHSQGHAPLNKPVAKHNENCCHCGNAVKEHSKSDNTKKIGCLVQCEDVGASVLCLECGDHFCGLCYTWQHRSGARAGHHAQPLPGVHRRNQKPKLLRKKSSLFLKIPEGWAPCNS